MRLSTGHLYRFGEFELDPCRRTFLRKGAPVEVTPKAFEVLAYLVANPGRVVTKAELLKAVWPDSFVEESNLSSNISILRRQLGATPDGGLTKYGAGTLTLTAASTYTGNTVVTNGTLVVNGSLGSTAVAVATNATLAGIGTAGTNLTVNSGGTLSPAGTSVIGTLTVAGNVTLQSGSTSFMELNKSLASSDRVRAAAAAPTTITYGGTLSLTNLAGALAATDTFKLFSATNYSGAFSAITPAVPALGLGWNTNTLATDGTLRLIATVNTTPTNITAVVAGNQLNLSWPPDHVGWRLQVETNSINTGLGTNWVDVPGSTTVSNVSMTIDPSNGTVFFRMVFP